MSSCASSMPSVRRTKSNDPIRRERRARQDDALRAREERRSQEVGDVVRRAIHAVPPVCIAALDPRDRFRNARFGTIDHRFVREHQAQREVPPAFAFGRDRQRFSLKLQASLQRASSLSDRAPRAALPAPARLLRLPEADSDLPAPAQVPTRASQRNRQTPRRMRRAVRRRGEAFAAFGQSSRPTIRRSARRWPSVRIDALRRARRRRREASRPPPTARSRKKSA